MSTENSSIVHRILLVEDSEHDVIAFRRTLKKSDVPVEITHFVRAEEALKGIVAHPSSFDLVVTDYKLPGMSGLSLCRLLAERDIPLPIVLLTGAGSEDLAIDALKSGAYDYVIKDQNQKYLELLPVVLVETIRKHGDRLERKRMEAALRESEEKYRNLYEGSRDGYAMVNMDGRVIESNKAFQEMVGYSKEELDKLTYQDLTPERWHQLENEMLKYLLKNDYTPLYQQEYRRKGGDIIPVELRGYLRKNKENKPTGIWAFVHDITDRKIAEENLQQRTFELGERVKELNCLYGISDLVVKYGHSPDIIIQRTVHLIPPSWQYPEITCARIAINDRVYKTETFAVTEWKQISNIIVKGEKVGTVEVFYLEARPQLYEGPFLKEERSLIDAIASRLGRIVERVEAEEILKQESQINAALSELYEPLISPMASIQDIAHTVLEQARSLTKSKHGFVSSIDPITGDNVGHTLSEMMKGECSITQRKRITFPLGEDNRYGGLWGYCLNTLKSFYTNSARQHMAAEGLPDGHIPIRRFLSVPVMLGDKLVGQISLANKEKDYTARDIESISRVAEFYALAIQRSRAREALQKAKDELEERVHERTKKLLMTNMKLKREVEDRKLAQVQLQQSKAMLQAVFDGIAEPLILVDKYSKVIIINKVAAEYHGLDSSRDVTGKYCYQVFKGGMEPCEECEIPQKILEGHSLTFERRGFMDPARLEQVFVYPIKDKVGKAGDAIIRITDITEAKQIERQLIQNEKMASLGILVSSIAHEINNPNNFVSFNIPILREYTMEIIPYLDKYAALHPNLELCNMPYLEFRQDILKLIDNIENGSRRISTFVSNLREYSQGGSIKTFSWLDLAVLIDKVLAIIKVEINKTVKTFNKSISTNLPEIHSDPHAIEQILINLLVNASQAVNGENSHIDLTVMATGDKRDVVIAISDNGCGMGEDTRQKIFDPFFTTKPAAKGTGLGLYVCHNLIQGLGGQIEVESKPGTGSTFRVILPCNLNRKEE
jgi:PAS domain S-box-containing protein